MGEDKFDVIIVGGGLAGSAAAYRLAQEGMEVLVIERGNYSGAKNMTGGRLYAHSMERLIPNFAQSAPVERRITRERLSMLTPDSAVTVEYNTQKPSRPGTESYSVLRASFDRWLAEQAEEQGAMYVYGIRVDDLIVEDGKVCGVVAGEENMYADLVILADGVHSLLAQKLGMKEQPKPQQIVVGAKEIIGLDRKVLEERFGLDDQEGLAWLLYGDCTNGQAGEGFLYTNKESLSVGVVLATEDIGKTDLALSQAVDRLTGHPALRGLLAGGKVEEYSAHLIPVGGYSMVPELYRSGVLLAGDAAALVIHKGTLMRGMDLAIESGRLAAEAAIAAKEKGDYSAETLSAYGTALEESFVLRDLKHYDGHEEHAAVYKEFPAAADAAMEALFLVDGKEPNPSPQQVLHTLSQAMDCMCGGTGNE